MNVEVRVRKGTRWTSYNFLIWKSIYRPGENPGRELIANFYSIREEDLKDEVMRDRYLAKAKNFLLSRFSDQPSEAEQLMKKLRLKMDEVRGVAKSPFSPVP